MKIPVIAIVGRPNVGKSSFFNALVGSRVSIVDETAGVTRDRVATEIRHDGCTLELIDTGGIGLFDDALLKEEVENQIEIAIASADGILFLVDIREGLLPLDKEVARRLRKIDKPVVLVANKADHLTATYEGGVFHSLGFGDPLPASALERRSVFEALDLILEKIPDLEEIEHAEESVPKVAVVGKQNAGKSTLVNKLAQADRVIVSEIPGTTRDSVDVRIQIRDLVFTVIDTAGLRRKKSIQDSIEFYGQARSARAIRRADVVLLLIDATQDISQVDKAIADMVVAECKPCIIGLNKWDLAEGHDFEAFEKYVASRLPGLRFAPLSRLSAMTGLNMNETFSLVSELYEQAGFRASTAEVNRVLEEALTQRSPRVKKSKVPKIYFGVQVRTRPPTLLAFVNDPKLFNDEYRRYLVGRFQEALPFKEIPLRILFRGKPKGKK